jgi:hypothetical protein
MANYTLHLGYNWNSPTIGSIWTTESGTFRFLQYALADGNGAPAWFQFQPDDELYVQAWDLSSTAPVPSAWSLDMSLSPLDAGPTATYDPATYLSFTSATATVQSQTVGVMTESYLQFSSFDFHYGSYTSPWGPCRGQSSSPLGPLTFLRASSFKLSFSLSATASHDGDRTTEVFLSDPEVIVGSDG